MVTIYDIAKAAQVSPMTVSRVINQSPLISESTRKKVEKVIEEMEYIPNKQARSLTSKATKLVSLVLPDISNPFFTSMARGAEDKAMQFGYQLILGNTDENRDKEGTYLDMLVSTGVDGILIVPTGDASAANIKKLIKRRIPFVFLDRFISSVSADVVSGDNMDTTRKLVRHLIEQGHKRIALINGPSSASNARERSQAFMETLALAGLKSNPNHIIETHFKEDNLGEIVQKWTSLRKEERPTAILAANNFIGVNTLRALRSLGIRIPEDVAVACFDDPDIIPDYNPILTVAKQPAYDMGFLGMQLLIDRIEKKAPEAPRKIVLPSRLILRSSTLSKKG